MSTCLPGRAEEFQSYPKGKGQWSGCISHVFQKVPSVSIAESVLVGDKAKDRYEGCCYPVTRVTVMDGFQEYWKKLWDSMLH